MSLHLRKAQTSFSKIKSSKVFLLKEQVMFVEEELVEKFTLNKSTEIFFVKKLRGIYIKKKLIEVCFINTRRRCLNFFFQRQKAPGFSQWRNRPCS